MEEKSKEEYKGVWVLGEVRDGEIHAVSYELLAWGRELADKLKVDLTVLVLGHHIRDKARELIYGGADRVMVVDHSALTYFTVDPFAAILTALIHEEKPEVFIASATTMGRTLMPVLAVKVTAGLTADCTELDIDMQERLLIQTRPAVGGNIMATIKTPDFKPQMATVRPKSKRPLEQDKNRQGEMIVKEFDDKFYPSRVKRLDFIREETIGVPIQDAETIVAFGKGLKDGKNLALINELATLLHGSVGASRSAIDAGWISYSHQVGLSGKTVSPRLYMACGISGAVQHLAGMSSAETIVAINSDPDAEIFSVADYGIVGDLFEILPVLIEKIKHEQKGA
ncbi:MAG: electron transfer flavoprotein subunit alpha/FixB family protein [Desulfobacteraceae bacterium]|nr:electron transfer flavoprotein subunit alpha/FixB family protein [Desulfobacteraceae bacterium]MBU4002072.1 electron transfer flavoprotein subunit alpha/FixB family protein [Pseudomonadota bacterium]